MKIGPRYKRARRLGGEIFDKTQTQKFALHLSAKGKDTLPSRPRTDFGIQMLEKQKARFMYGINERQFKRYVREAIADRSRNAGDTLFERLESRLDNVVYRLGLAPSRMAARQLVSHGHITVNSKRVTIPSINVRMKDMISIRPGSQSRVPFQDLEERLKQRTIPGWLAWDQSRKSAEVGALPKVGSEAIVFDINAILEFYRR